MKRSEKETTLADLDYWQGFGTALGWRLLGFTYRQGATFVTRSGETIQISGLQRDDIVNRLEKVKA